MPTASLDRLSFEEPRFQLRPTLALQRLGRLDPTAEQTPDRLVKWHVGADGLPLRQTIRREGERVEVEVCTEGSPREHVDGLPFWQRQLPLDDGIATFDPDHPLLRRLHATFKGLRLLRVPWLFDVAVGAVLQQRVTFADAATGFSRLARKWGSPALEGFTLPGAERLAGLPLHELQALGIDARRGRTLLLLAREHVRRGLLRPDVEPGALREGLMRIPGIGPWTTEMILGFALGDADAVPVGDLHLPRLVVGCLAGERVGTDRRMIEVLEPYRGQRFRVVRLLWSALFHAPQLLPRGVR